MAIYFSGNSSNNNVSLSNCHFVGNTAVVGGGLLGEFNDRAQNNSLNLLYCYFIENTCFNSIQVNGGGGGGVCLDFLLYKPNSVANNEIHIEYTLFEQNTAYLGGGLSFVTGYEQGVLAPTNQLAMMSSIFQHNIARLGSAVNLMPWNSPSTAAGLVAKVEILAGKFMNNSVAYNHCPSYWMGLGTIYSYKVPFHIAGTISYFGGNTGSGIVVVGTGVTFHSDTQFHYNAAINGGAIAAYGNGWLTLWDTARLYFINNTGHGRGGAIYSASIGGHEVVESKDCIIQYFEWWKRYEEWNCMLYFSGNLAKLGGNDIYVSSLYPCIRSGSNGSADISIEARKRVFRSKAFHYCTSSNDSRSIMTSATTIENDAGDFPLINAIPGQLYDFATKLNITPEDDLGALSMVPFYATTEVSNVRNPAAYISEDEQYTTRYLRFLASNNVASNETMVQLQTLFDPILLIHFNVSLSQCPPGTYLSIHGNLTSGQCTCAQDPSFTGYLTGVSCYEQGGDLYIQRQGSYWVGRINVTSNESIIATANCPEQYCGIYFNKVHLVLTDPTYGLCKHGSHGIICGTCKHGIFITSPTFECCTQEEMQDISAPAAWLSWAGIQIFLTTIIVFTILLFDFDVIGGTLCSFVFFSQVVLTLNLQSCLPVSQANSVILSFYAIWSLRFRWIIPWAMGFCMPTFDNTLQALALDYVFMFYPFLLIFCVWAFLYCQYQGWCCRCCHSLCIRLNVFFYRFRQLLAQRTSLVHGIATCLVLTYGDLVSVSFFLLSPVTLNVPNNISNINDIPGGPRRSFYNGDYVYFGHPHYWFGVPALFMVVLFGFFPPFFLMSYPVLPRVLSKCSVKLGDKVEGWYQKRAVHHLLELFQGHYKDNRRFFAGMWFFYRLVLQANDAFSLCSASFSVQILISIGFLLVHSILQPYKEAKFNALDRLLFANMALLSTLALWANEGRGSADITGFTAALAIFLTLPYLYFICIILYRVANKVYGRFCCKGQDPGERQPLINAASAALSYFVFSRNNSTVRLANDSDSDSGDEDGDDDGRWKRDELQPGLHAVSIQQPSAGSTQAVEDTNNMQSSNVQEALVTA